MKGENLKKKLRDAGFQLSEIANLLGFDNDQRLHSALRSDDIKTGLLEKIAQATNKNVCFFYNEQDLNPHSTNVLQEKDKTISLLEENAALLRKQVTLLEEKIAFLEEERTKKIERAVSSKKSVATDAHAIFHQL